MENGGGRLGEHTHTHTHWQGDLKGVTDVWCWKQSKKGLQRENRGGRKGGREKKNADQEGAAC